MQVSVRKAALGVIAALLKALPGQAAPAQLWVTSALPMVRDVEASLQEQLLDHVHTFLMVPAGLCLPQPIPVLLIIWKMQLPPCRELQSIHSIART